MTKRYIELPGQEEYNSGKYLRRDRKRNKKAASKSHKCHKYVVNDKQIEDKISEYIVTGYKNNDQDDMFDFIVSIDDLKNDYNNLKEVLNENNM